MHRTFFDATNFNSDLSKWDVSKAYPLVGVGFLFTVAIGWYLGVLFLLRLSYNTIQCGLDDRVFLVIFVSL